MGRRAALKSDDQALLTGDGAAFAAFYRRHEDAVLGFVLRRTACPELAADLASEAFACAWLAETLSTQRVARRAPGCSASPGTSSRAASTAAASRTRRAAGLGMEPLVLDDHALARIDQLSGQPALTALGLLPADRQLAVAGRVLDEQDYQALAGRMKCSESVVRQRVSRGLRTLRAQLGEQR
jgi:DNA-directed RNA polymerase specialized sigma24 family protein